MSFLSKRTFIQSAGIFLSLLLLSGCAGKITDPQTKYAYVATTQPNGYGIYLMNVNPKDHSLKLNQLISPLPNATSLVIDKAGKYVYAVSNVNNYNQLFHGSIVSYSIDKKSGELTFLNQVSSRGSGPNYLFLHPSGKFLFVANGNDGQLAVFSLKKDGEIGSAVSVKQSHGKSTRSKLPISIAHLNNYHGPHATAIQSDPTGKYVISTDSALGQIYQWKFNNGKLTANNPASVRNLTVNKMPYHFVFHPNSKYIYVSNRANLAVTVYRFNEKKGTLVEQQLISPTVKGKTGQASDIVINQNGSAVYVINETGNSIEQYFVASDGKLTWIGSVSSHGIAPQSMTFSPNGEFAFVANLEDDSIAQFKIDKNSKLIYKKRMNNISNPTQIVFLPQTTN